MFHWTQQSPALQRPPMGPQHWITKDTDTPGSSWHNIDRPPRKRCDVCYPSKRGILAGYLRRCSTIHTELWQMWRQQCMERSPSRFIEAITNSRLKMEAYCYQLHWKAPHIERLWRHHGNCWSSRKRSHSYTLWEDWHAHHHAEAYSIFYWLPWDPCKYSIRLRNAICQWNVGTILWTTRDQMTIVYCLSRWNGWPDWVNERDNWAIPTVLLQPQSIKLGVTTANGAACNMWPERRLYRC